jgi:hypothetical protein
MPTSPNCFSSFVIFHIQFLVRILYTEAAQKINIT